MVGWELSVIAMLKKSLRLKKKEDFDRVFREGRAIFFEEIVCRFLEKPSGTFRVGFSLSKKQLPLAVDRNRFRRVLSALMAAEKKSWPKTLDVVFSLRRKPKTLSRDAASPALAYFQKAIENIRKK